MRYEPLMMSYIYCIIYTYIYSYVVNIYPSIYLYIYVYICMYKIYIYNTCIHVIHWKSFLLNDTTCGEALVTYCVNRNHSFHISRIPELPEGKIYRRFQHLVVKSMISCQRKPLIKPIYDSLVKSMCLMIKCICSPLFHQHPSFVISHLSSR